MKRNAENAENAEEDAELFGRLWCPTGGGREGWFLWRMKRNAENGENAEEDAERRDAVMI